MSANVLTIDVETLTSNKGQPFDQTNKLVCIGLKSDEVRIYYDLYNIESPILQVIQNHINKADLLVGFNIKFDLHWLRKIGIDFSGKRIWDCQLAEFILNNQATPYPSLDQAAEKYGFEKKLDFIKLNYWDKGIDTDQIPRDELSDYLEQDLTLTEQVYLRQRELFKDDKRFALFRLQCQDLLVLEEMEWNGILFKTEKALEKAKELESEIETINSEVSNIIGSIPFNLGSDDHVSAILYGGSITIDDRIPVGFYKSGTKVGHPRYKIIEKVYELPRLVEPLERTETKKGLKYKEEGRLDKITYEVNETVLRKLKLSAYAKKIVKLIRRYAELNKLKSTYLEGYAKLIEKMNWKKDMLHGNLNQCVVITGRLSSSKP